MLGWRSLPTDNSSLGPTARAGEPAMRQLFLSRPDAIEDDLAYERKLYLVRRRIENAVRACSIPGRGAFYVPSLSHRTLVYKGMLIAPQLPAYFPDLVDPRVESALAMVHSRFSTNTFPNWARAHPYRYVCHNGEINTLRGNVNWMHARESLFSSSLFGDDLAKLLPVIDAERQRLGHVRQRARAAGARRPIAAARGDDDDPGAVGGPRVDEPRRSAPSTSTTPA